MGKSLIDKLDLKKVKYLNLNKSFLNQAGDFRKRGWFLHFNLFKYIDKKITSAWGYSTCAKTQHGHLTGIWKHSDYQEL
jgi:hypothetical protein